MLALALAHPTTDRERRQCWPPTRQRQRWRQPTRQRQRWRWPPTRQRQRSTRDLAVPRRPLLRPTAGSAPTSRTSPSSHSSGHSPAALVLSHARNLAFIYIYYINLMINSVIQ